jgi:hypothetical protein
VSQISDLQFLYLHKKLAATGNTPATLTASAGTVRTAVCAALTEADDYWNGAIALWTSGPNAGLYSSVKDFVAGTDTLEFDEDLPNAVANTHQFVLLHGGKHISDQRIPGMTAAALVNVTGFSIHYTGVLNGEGNGTLKFYYNGGAGQGLTWTPPGGTEGSQVDISGLANGQRVSVFAGGATDEEKSKYITVQRTAAALPGADQTDVIALVNPSGTFLGAILGAETAAGVTVYRPVGIKNAGADKVYGVKAYCPQPFAGAVATTIAAGGNIGTGAATLKGTSLANWGSHGWVYNSTKNDLRYYYNRSGNSCSILNPGAGMRDFVAVAWDVADNIEPYPWMDIGLDAPGAGSIFEDPASESTAPAGVAFTAPRTSGTGLLIGDLAAAAVYCVWERYFIPAGFQPVESGKANLRLYAEVTG